MTGKQLKEFAAKCPDDAEVEARERSYAFEKNFEIRAIISLDREVLKKEEVDA